MLGSVATLPFELVDRGLVPDAVLRAAIRAICRSRLRDERRLAARDAGDPLARHVALLRTSPVSVHSDAALDQHYDVPPGFYRLVLGPRLKYSACFWPAGVETLAAAEDAALAQVAARAQLADGQRILDLGCGWGSFALFAAQRLPHACITAVSHAREQRLFLEQRAAEWGLSNVRVVTSRFEAFEPDGAFDRIVSIEMLEHLRNYEHALARIASWLEPRGGLFFAHVFAHARHAYLYEDQGPSDWMARTFFTGGQMPAAALLDRFPEQALPQERWWLDGTHYARTAEAWLANLDRERAAVEALFAERYGAAEASRRCERWRVFFLACAEMFAYARGAEWGVSHHLFAPGARARRAPAAAEEPVHATA